MTIRAGSRPTRKLAAVRVCADLDHALHIPADDGGADRERPHGSHHRPRHCGQPASALSLVAAHSNRHVAADRQCPTISEPTSARWPMRRGWYSAAPATGLICLVVAEILKLILVERLFRVSRNKLMSIPAFALAYGKYIAARH